ncbi:MAG: hypothetical protein V4733_04870 [Verrucomicrobiota bacterium]
MKSKVTFLAVFAFFLAAGGFWWRRGDADSNNVGVISGRPSSSSTENKTIRPPRPERDVAAISGRRSSHETPSAPLASPVHAMAASGDSATAEVVINGARHRLVPNQLGEFQRVYVETGGSVDVTVRYAGAKPGEKVIAAMQDGGTLNGKGIAEQFTVDSSGNIAFSAETRDEGGIHRVLLTKGADRKTLDIWGGPESPLKAEIQ